MRMYYIMYSYLLSHNSSNMMKNMLGICSWVLGSSPIYILSIPIAMSSIGSCSGMRGKSVRLGPSLVYIQSMSWRCCRLGILGLGTADMIVVLVANRYIDNMLINTLYIQY